jgi:hypothetical protein
MRVITVTTTGKIWLFNDSLVIYSEISGIFVTVYNAFTQQNKKYMEKVIINSYEDFEKLVGQQIGVSEYVELTQERINLFADATLDHQWIHIDTERAKTESPFKSTIAHG